MTTTPSGSRRIRKIDTAGRLMTTTDAAERLGLSPRTLDNWRYQPSTGPRWVKVGGRIRYPEAELVAYLDERAVVSAIKWVA